MKLRTNQTLYAYWNELRAGRIAPRRLEVEPSRINSVLAETFMLERASPSTYRYRLAGGFSDGLTGEEGTFSMCSFWYVECLSRMGDLHKARFFFEKMLGYANHLGLYGEELGPQAQHLGNFPQAFTHLALISAAFDLDRRLSAAGHAG